MIELLLVSLIWAFSFGIIKDNLAGVNPAFITFARLLVAALIFLPFLRTRRLPGRLSWRLVLTGALQYGVMYVAYNSVFQYLKAYEVALFTIFTPIYVTLIHDGLQKRFNGLNLGTAALAVVGTGIVEGSGVENSGILTGFLLMQLSNLCFAFGQVYYKELLRDTPGIKDRDIFALLYAGGALVGGLGAITVFSQGGMNLGGKQWLSLLYLGAVASGLGFFMWNHAARRARVGVLAIFNDLKIPLAVVVSLLFFGEQADVLRLIAGGAIVAAALALNEMGARRLAQARFLRPRPMRK
jgi:drug/metabolite transporter (DMT)-like permease